MRRLFLPVAMFVACEIAAHLQAAELPAPVDRKVDFARDVKPLFQKHCWSCHSERKHESGLRLDSRAGLLRGGDAGKAVMLGKSADSRLIQFVAAVDPKSVMPPEGDRLSAEAVGIMDWIRDATVDYLRVRQQFGTALGKFQAIRHRMATVLLEIEQARSSAINAAAALSAGRLLRERATSAAKVTIGRVGTLVAEEAIQLHGGIGMTWDLPLAHYAKRLVMIGHQLGDEDYHIERFVALAADEIE